ncbi:hypothetical protein MM1218R_01523 [Mycobacterium marinum]|uniref:Tail assembly chaperone n=1 Tax=Mycobacterium marinum (strain ATCC BAA-535 / M) TaxID=216594 RepID=B2HNP6_MYCMM|nr:hypothetical protein [Mycobacterium marinum]ACC42299.1 hypothetical protein MMAR_3887 [Mycobacterium marinum M]AXN43471.1 hypothetical protein MM1218R_01523 [Mycobacterium marinum]RFZ11477.1 hypothetical protein DE4381_01065 [Mycobacterium marinum]
MSDMSTPMQAQQPYQAIPTVTPVAKACTLPPPGWVCSREAGHAPPCAASQDSTEPPAPSPEQGAAPAAPSASERAQEQLKAGTSVTVDQGAPYWLPRNIEADLDLPSGGRVRYRKIRDGSELELDLVELLDGFTPEMVVSAQGDDRVEMTRAIANKENRAKIFDPIDRVVVAAVVCPRIVASGPSTDEQINVKDVDLTDRIVIFQAAFGEQLAKLKSVFGEPQEGLRDLQAGQGPRTEAQ